MTGVDILGNLAVNDAQLLEVVPEEQMKAGMLPANVSLPALLFRSTSSVERQTLKRGVTVRTTDRVAVLVRANSYDEQVAIIKLLKRRLAGRVGAIGGGSAVSILTAGTGPDLIGPGNTFEQTQDFRVSYDAQGDEP